MDGLLMENPIKMDDLGYHCFRKHPCIEKCETSTKKLLTSFFSGGQIRQMSHEFSLEYF